MNYPVWELTTIGGGTLIAIISILHVYIAHLAVGGGIFLWLTDLKGFRENSPAIHQYVKKHTWFFLLLTMVFGGMTGVGIWFIIALVNPAATTTLIHTFVFGWAIEWVFFVGEITALLIYHYNFDQLSRKPRLTVAFFYALFAWLSLVIINGILSFMLTPGSWLDGHGFWAGFFNPTYFSSLVFRTFMTLMIAGLFGYLTAVYLKDGELRLSLMKYCTKWLLYPLPGLVLSAVWYYYSIPSSIRHTAFILNPQSTLFINLFLITTIVIFVVGLLQALKMRLSMQRLITYLLVVIGLIWMGGFEYSREIARKPYIINQYMYSTSLHVDDVEKVNYHGYLNNARWSPIKTVHESNLEEAGKELFNLQCLSCHTVNGIRNDIISRSESFTYLGMISQLTGQGKIQNYMPPFMGTAKEKEALATYITATLLKKEVIKNPEASEIRTLPDEIPAYDKNTNEYVLLVWNDFGMHCISDSDPWFVILPPANTLEAQLIKRGEVPELVSDDIKITYAVEEGFENPSKHVDFWKYSEANFGRKIDDNIGLFGNGMKGEFRFNEDLNSFIAQAIPVVPYRDDGTYLPYPQFTIEAKNISTGKVLVSTRVVAPVSTEIGCRNCHEGDWRVNNVAGIDAETSTNILAVHDRINGTGLLSMAQGGQPQLCQSCHEDVAVGAEGKPDVLNFSTAMHGWHANYMPYNDGRACVLCHPAADRGNTRCSRGFHNSLNMTCITCHGTMQEHGLALLKGQAEKPAAQALMTNLKVTNVSSVEDINPRLPWVKEPDCLNCHVDYEIPPANAIGFNQWNDDFSELYRIRTDNAGIRCEGCHGSTHALYPAKNPFGRNRDNVQPLQYSGTPLPIGSNFSCEVCHMKEMTESIHHENMEHMFRNAALIP